ncbi:MAG: serine O-acetyltransferase EpsC [bacterium]
MKKALSLQVAEPHLSMPELAAVLVECGACHRKNAAERGLHLAGRTAIYSVLEKLTSILFPGCHGHATASTTAPRLRINVATELEIIEATLHKQIELAFQYQCEFEHCRNCNDCRNKAVAATQALLQAMPEIKRTLELDITAAYEGDPAARSTMEVVMSYPGLLAIMTHRIAHELYNAGVPLIPRILSEHAHSQTGIDIHPGAKIGPGFFIDHGTGVVIGETCVIGSRVKLYQGVTLGALSFPKDKHGYLIKGNKRHPNVEDNVTIYAGATILGGDTTIGTGSEIGGNVWLTHSIPPGSRVYNQQPKPLIRTRAIAHP